MLAKEFYNEVTDETKAVAFLRRNDFLVAEKDFAPCHRCGGKMKETQRKGRNGKIQPTLRCKARGCQTFRSIHSGNVFSHFTVMSSFQAFTMLNFRITFSLFYSRYLL